MLYARDDIRIAEAAYAITEPLDSIRPGPILERLDRIRLVVGYLYSSPHPTRGDPFMPFEFANMVVVQPANVSTFLVRPDYRTILPPLPDGFVEDNSHQTRGYEGVFNRRPVWLVKSSRLYGGRTHTVLNMSQDLRYDIGGYRDGGPSGRELLLELLDRPLSPFIERIFMAIEWYNYANGEEETPDRKLLSLAVAFETLLELPSNEKTDRLADGIALLLGRTARLKDWANQFYAARSQVAHEGRVRDWWFYSAKPAQKGDPGHRMGSVMNYGLEIFQHCLTTILTGAMLAERSGLAERFVANSERYMLITKGLGRTSGDLDAAIIGIEPLVNELDRYQFVSSPVPIWEVIKALRAAAKALSQCSLMVDDQLAIALEAFYDGPKKDELAALSALEALEIQVASTDPIVMSPAAQVLAKLIKVGWRALFLRYFQLKDLSTRAVSSS
jgi:hypothetical protein